MTASPSRVIVPRLHSVNVFLQPILLASIADGIWATMYPGKYEPSSNPRCCVL